MASCENIRKLSAHHDGELPTDEAQRVAQHLRQCPSCRQELEQLRAISQWLSASPAPAVPEEVLARLRRSFRPRRDRIILRTAKTLTTAAAAVLVVCSALLWQRWHIQPPSVAAPARWETAATQPEELLVATESRRDTDVQIIESILKGLPNEGG